MILRSLRLIGEKARGATLTANEQTECLDSLNAMMESWTIDRLMVYQITQESFALTASQGAYTIGTGGNFNTTRPTRLVDPCFIRDGSNYDSPVRLINIDAYGKIVDKTTDGSYPTYLYYDAGFSATSTATINLYPEPQAGLTLYINSWKQLQSFANVSTALLLPPGYERAIVFNYAIEEAGGFTSVSPEVAKIARESKAAIKSMNLPDVTMRVETGILSVYGRSNILTG